MSFTQSDLDRVDRAIAKGALTVELDGKRVTYRSMAELTQARRMISDELNRMNRGPASMSTLASFTRD